MVQQRGIRVECDGCLEKNAYLREHGHFCPASENEHPVLRIPLGDKTDCPHLDSRMIYEFTTTTGREERICPQISTKRLSGKLVGFVRPWRVRKICQAGQQFCAESVCSQVWHPRRLHLHTTALKPPPDSMLSCVAVSRVNFRSMFVILSLPRFLR